MDRLWVVPARERDVVQQWHFHRFIGNQSQFCGAFLPHVPECTVHDVRDHSIEFFGFILDAFWVLSAHPNTIISDFKSVI